MRNTIINVFLPKIKSTVYRLLPKIFTTVHLRLKKRLRCAFGSLDQCQIINLRLVATIKVELHYLLVVFTNNVI